MDDRTWDLIVKAFWPLFVQGVSWTIPLTLASFAVGLVLALLAAVGKLSHVKVFQLAASGYIAIFRGTPLLVQLFIIFYGFPTIGLKIDAIPSAILGFSLNVGAYAAESIRASILAVPTGQLEAAATIGMDYPLALRRVVLPQALRIAVPPLSNTFISLVKDTSLASGIMVAEMFRKAQEIAAPAYAFFWIYVEVALIYLLFCSVLTFGQGKLERHLNRYITA
ncbi:MAG: amino acid ABC transporter permease [Propionibacteriaceae bacterium]|jgi:cystine transport system permease protein|nr:amino acid ABC transporter permease [Propionibacteriaceae bacterium]